MQQWRWVVCGLPREDARYGFTRRSEDAYFAHSPKGNSSELIFGLADGVGGLRGRADPGEYARRLMYHAASCAADGEKISSPRELLRDAAALLAAERIAGGATALIARTSADGRIDAVNLGDVSLFVARADGAIAASAPRGLVSFDTPRQLGALFDDGPPIRFDTAADALSFDAQLESGGWLVAATDGVTDNLFMTDIAIAIKAAAARGDADLGILARELVSAARAASNDRSRDSPFSLNAKDHDVLWSKGGRPDDITVLVARYGCSALSCSATSQGHDLELVSAARGLVPENAASNVKIKIMKK